MIRSILTVSISTLIAVCVGSSAMAAEASATASPSLDFVARAQEGDIYEQQAGAMAVVRARNAGVKTLGETLVVDHARSWADVAGAVTASNLTAPAPVVTPAKTAMLDALRNAPAEQFDALFLSQQVQVHEEALALNNGYAASGDNAALRAAAQKAVPMVNGHLDRARTLAAQVR